MPIFPFKKPRKAWKTKDFMAFFPNFKFEIINIKVNLNEKSCPCGQMGHIQLSFKLQ